MAVQKSDLAAIHARKRQDFEESISGGIKLARFEANLGTLASSLTTIIIILFITIHAYLEPAGTPPRAILIGTVCLAGGIGILSVLLIKKRVLGWLQQLQTDTFNARRKADENYSTQP